MGQQTSLKATEGLGSVLQELYTPECHQVLSFPRNGRLDQGATKKRGLGN